MRTGRPKQPLLLSEEERERLESVAHRARSQPLLARRARVVLACGDGLDNDEVARKLRCSRGMVVKWRARFLKQRLEGLYDEPRPGAPRKVSDEQVERVVIQTLEHAARADTLEHAGTGEDSRTEPHDHQPDLASLRIATASQRHLQVVTGPAADRESARYCGRVYPPSGSCTGAVRGREEPDSGAGSDTAAAAHAARPAGARHARLQAARDDFPVRRTRSENQSRDWPVPPPTSCGGIPPVSGYDRSSGSRRAGRAS